MNNQKFKDAYNRLDRYLQSLVNVDGFINLVSYYERLLPEKKRSELRTIREFKNMVESHGVSIDGKVPLAPKEFTDWLLKELIYCKSNKEIISKKMQNLIDKRKKKKDTHKETYDEYYARKYGFKIRS